MSPRREDRDVQLERERRTDTKSADAKTFFDVIHDMFVTDLKRRDIVDFE